MGAIQNSINSALGTGAVLAGGAKKLKVETETAKNAAETAQATAKATQLAQQTFDKNDLRDAEQQVLSAKTSHQQAYNEYVAADDANSKAELEKEMKELRTGKTFEKRSSEAMNDFLDSQVKEVLFDAQHEGKQLTPSEKGQRTRLANRTKKAQLAFDALADEQQANTAIGLRLNEKKFALEEAKKRYDNATDRYNELKADYEKKYGGKKN
jgi:hypothetical protein